MKQWLIDQEDDQKVVVISGTSGIGKSALACEFALEHQTHFPDGIYSVRVNEKKYTNNEDFRETIARDLLAQLGIDEDEIKNGQKITKTMKDHFANIQALIIFDNVETDTIRELFPRGKCSIIVTTISHRLFQSSSYKYIELLLPNQVKSQDRERLVNESLELLKKLVGENRRQEITQNESIAKEILNLIAYLPLAVKIISIPLERMFENDSLNDFLSNLRNERNRLILLRPERDTRNLDVWYSFALAFKGLSEEKAKEIFVCLGACAQTGFSINLIGATIGFDRGQIKPYLKILKKNYFVQEIKVNENASYFMPKHNLIHDFARLLLEKTIVLDGIIIPDDLDKKTKDNHAKYFVDLVYQINNQATYYCKDFFAKLNRDFDNFYLAIKYLAESREESTLPNFKSMLDNGMFGSKVPEFFIQYGYGSQFIELIDLCIGRIHPINSENDDFPIDHIRLLFDKNKFLKGEKRLKEKEELLEDLRGKIEQLNSQISKDYFKAVWQKSSGGTRQGYKKFREAESFFRECIDILENIENSYSQEELQVFDTRHGIGREYFKALTYRSWGLNQQKLAEDTNDDAETKRCYFKQARNYFKKTLDIYESLQADNFHKALPLGNLGELLVNFGEFEKQQQNGSQASELFKEAIRVLSDGLNISEQQGLLKGKNITLKNLIMAKACIANSESDRQEIEELVDQVENERSLVILLNKLADVYINKEDYEKAEIYAEIYIVRAIEIDKNKQNTKSLIQDYLTWLNIFEKKGTLENNHDIDIVELVNLNEKLGEYLEKAVGLIRIAKLLSKDDHDNQARQRLQESIEICIQHKYPGQLDQALTTFIEIEKKEISRCQNKQGKNKIIDEAVELLNQYYEQARQTQLEKIQEPLVRHLLKLYDLREILPRELAERRNCLKQEHKRLKRK